MGQKKCSKVGISFGDFYMVIWGSSTRKLNRASAQIDFIHFSRLVSFWSGGGFCAMDKCTRKIQKTRFFPRKITKNRVFWSLKREKSIGDSFERLQILLPIEKTLQRWIETAYMLPLQVVFFCRLVLSNCVRSYATSKPIELKSPTTSQIKDNFKGSPTVL